MHVLVCDDDASTRYVIKRLLLQSSGCRITECADGVECLRALEQTGVDLVILDIEMPNLGGLEVLESIRRSETHQALPVILLTAERRAEVVSKLLQFGVLGYVLKPLRSERLMPFVERVRRSYRAKARPAAASDETIRLDPDNPALLIDGNADYRHFFVSYAERFGPVIAADSGLAGLAQFKRAPVNLVFVGESLGLIDSDLLCRKLRLMRAGQPLRIVSIHDAHATPDAGADDELPRSVVPDVHRAEMRRFLRLTGPLDRVSGLIGDMNELLVNAAMQVFGMMLDSQVEAADLPSYGAELRAAGEITVKKELAIGVDVRMSRADARRIAARMMLTEPEGLSDDDILASVQELANLLMGRLHARFGERQIASECGVPKCETFASQMVDVPEETHGLRRVFTVPAVQGTFAIVVRATRAAGREEAAA